MLFVNFYKFFRVKNATIQQVEFSYGWCESTLWTTTLRCFRRVWYTSPPLAHGPRAKHAFGALHRLLSGRGRNFDFW